MAEKEPEVIDSPLSKFFTDNGKTVEVCIYTLDIPNSKWSLEVVDQDGNSTVWDDEFEADNEAWDEFLKDVSANGIDQFIGSPPKIQ
jgi:hypothetical protein